MTFRTAAARAGSLPSLAQHGAALLAASVLAGCVQQPAPADVEPVRDSVVVSTPPPRDSAQIAVAPVDTVLTPAPTPAATPTPAPATPGETAVGFIVMRNADTLAAERFTRRQGRVEGELLIRGADIRQTYEMTVDPTATVTRFQTAAYRATDAAGTPPAQSLVARFDANGATIEMGGQTSQIPAAPGTVPFINLSAAVIEQILLKAKAMGGPAAEVPVLVMAGGQTTTASVRWIGADSAVIMLGPELRVEVSPSGRLLGGFVPSQGVSFIRDGSAPRPMSQARDYSAPPGAPYRAEAVTVRNPGAGVNLAGTLTMPHVSSGTRVPAVVLITGSGLQDRDESSPGLRGWRPFRQFADTLGRRGIAVLRLDDRGVGGSDRGPAGATTADLADDIRAAVEYLRSRPDIAAGMIGLVGHSEGAWIASMVAADDPTVRAVVLIAGASRSGRRISDAQIAQAFDERGITGQARDSLTRANAVVRDSIMATQPWVRFFMTYDPLPTAKRLRTPVLILQGATDRQVSADQAEELAQAIRSGGNRDVTVRVFEKVNHLLVDDPDGGPGGYAKLPSLAVRADVLGTMADWLAAKLAPR